MKKIIIAMCMIFVVMTSLGFAVAGKNNMQKQGNEFSLPENAVEVAPGVFYLGKALDKGKVVEGYAFVIKDKKEFARATCGDGKCHPVFEDAESCSIDCGGVPDPDPDPEEPDTSSCYTFLSEGAKWKSVEDYVVDTDNNEGLDVSFISNNLALDISKWESVAGTYNILGDGKIGDVDGADTISPDGKNEVMFGDIDSQGAIGVTIVWGVFSGPAKRRVLVEWDMIFDDADFEWGICEEGTLCEVMDFENIATHELGHAVGLGDLYNTECNTQTMFGYSDYGDTSKRTLEAGDIAGLNILY
ncbi:MAG: matrixin family metalloprotease [archaeon]